MSWLRFRIRVGARTNINACISQLSKSNSTALKYAHAAAGAAAGQELHDIMLDEDPARQIRKYRERLGYVHVKDWARGKFVELGQEFYEPVHIDRP